MSKRTNPEWTAKDFRKAKAPEKVLDPKTLQQFKKVRGPQKSPTKVPISIRLSPDVISHYKSKGEGWQAHARSRRHSGRHGKKT